MTKPRYHLVSHNKSAYTIRHSDGSHFQVAKKDLGVKDHSMIADLPHFAEGGEVGMDPIDIAPDLPDVGYVEQLPNQPPAQTANAEAFAQGQRPPILPSEADPMASRDPFEGMSAEALGRPVTPVVMPSERTSGAGPQVPQEQPQSPYADIFAQQQAAIDLRQQAEEGQAKANQKALKYQISQQELENTAFQAKFKEYTDRDTKLFSEASEGRIDPKDYWNSRTTGDKILATISLLLGGIGGMGHGNVGLDIINKAIDRDIESQKANINQSNNLFKMNMDRFHNEQAAHMGTKADLISMTAAKMNLAAAQAASPEAKSRAMAATAALGNQAVELRKQMAQQAARNEVMGTGGSISPYLNTLPPEEAKGYRERIVKMPTGKELLAYTPKAAEEVRTKAGQLTNLTGLIDRLDNIGPSALLPGTQQNQASEIRSALVTSLKELEKLGVLSGPDMALMDKRIRDRSSFRDLLGGKGKSDSLRESINNAFETAMGANVPGYKPAKKLTKPY